MTCRWTSPGRHGRWRAGQGYADATLILLAERLGVFDILTLDRRGFSVYRSAKGKRFTLLLEQGAGAV